MNLDLSAGGLGTLTYYVPVLISSENEIDNEEEEDEEEESDPDETRKRKQFEDHMNQTKKSRQSEHIQRPRVHESSSTNSSELPEGHSEDEATDEKHYPVHFSDTEDETTPTF